jgi:hypothetical protein
VVAGGGRWWQVVAGGGRWWVAGSGIWWQVVAGGGKNLHPHGFLGEAYELKRLLGLYSKLLDW